MRAILCFILLINGLFVYSQGCNLYEFPIKQGSLEWTNIKSIEKRIELLQMPDKTLKEISTECLLETCLQFPYLTDVLFAENYQKGFDQLLSEFNGFRELLKRQDLTYVLLNKYKNITVEMTTIKSQGLIEQGRFSFRHFVLEFLFTQDLVLKNVSQEQEKILFSLSIQQQEIKDSNKSIFSNLNLVPTNLLYAKKIINDTHYKFESEEQKKIIIDFIQSPISVDEQVITKIKNYINSKYKY